MTRRLIFGLAIALCLAGPVHADGEGVPPKAGHETPATFFGAEKTCQAASDGCRTCRRTGDTFSCSTPGIACVPGVWACTQNGN